MKVLSIILLLLISTANLFAQIEDITHLPVQNIADTLTESAPIVLSESEAIIFFVNSTQDTIFSTISRDGGNNWETPTAVIAVELGVSQTYLHLTSLRSTSGRILLAWAISNEGLLIYSDDNGTTWSVPQVVVSVGNPVFQRMAENLNLSQLDDGRILLGFDNNVTRVIYYIQSDDDGVTWSEETTEVYSSSFIVNGLMVVNSTESNLLAVFEGKPISSSGIYKLISTDNGLTWSDTIRIVNTQLNETRPKIVKRSDGSLLLTFLREDSTQISGFNQTDIYYMISSDGGETWQEEKRFTKYIGNDDFINISHLNGKTFISFASQRFTSNFQISYGVLEETIESYTPPYIFNPQLIYDGKTIPENITYRAQIIDDDQVASSELVIEELSISGSMYDDGMHDDLEANDNVWGNIFPIELPRNNDVYEIHINNISLPFDNKGVLADTRYSANLLALVNSTDINNNSNTSITFHNFRISRQGKYAEGLFLFSAGFYLSGYNEGELWSNGVTSSTLLADYLPGKVGTDPENNINVIYTVNKDDPPFGTSWQIWKDAVSLGAEFYDGDGDGVYNPKDKNRNGTWDTNEDMPLLLGDETSWCVFNDGVPSDERRFENVESLGIEIQQTLFATNQSELENVIFIKYKLTNTGLVNDILDSVYFSPWDDTDLGDYSDDLGGSDTLINSVFTYNEGEDFIYGSNPPAIYTTLLQGPVVESSNILDTAFVRNGEIIGEEIFPGFENLGLFSFVGYVKAIVNQGDPRDKYHVWNYIHARDWNGNILNPCDTIFGKVFGNVDCNKVNPLYWFSGDPVTQQGWLDIIAADDRKFTSTGSFTFEKNKPVEIILALVVGRGSDNLNSITVARENVQRAIAEYKSNFASMTYVSPPPTNPVTKYVLYHNYPNPFNPITTIRYEIPKDGIVIIKVYDILGQEVATLLNEFKKADRYEIKFNAVGLASGVYIYRIKVNDFIDSKKMILLR